MMRQTRRILLLGTGGHCRSVADSLIELSQYDEIGLVGKTGAGTPGFEEALFMGIPVVGSDDQLEDLRKAGYTDAFVAVGSIGDSSVRKRLYLKLKEIGFNLPNIIDQNSAVSKYAVLGEGIYIGRNAAVNAAAVIGNCAIINTASVIEHQCVIGDFVHVASGSTLCGEVTVGAGTHIGAGSVVKQGIHIGNETIIGMGSVVLKDIGSHVTAYGSPCKEVNQLP